MATENLYSEYLGGVTFSDSYPIVTKDSELWLDLFAYAYEQDHELFARLNYLRGTGTLLAKTGNAKCPYRLVPIISDDGWSSQEEWEQEKQCLNDYTSKLILCLQKL